MLVTAGAARGAVHRSPPRCSTAATTSLVASPNYATNLETPRALGADVETIELRFEDGWELDPERRRGDAAPRHPPGQRHLPAQPDRGDDRPRDAASALVDIVERHAEARLLVDETYRELAYGDPLPVAAGLSPRALSVSSMSKTYGLPGLRIGWLTCRDRELAETLLAAKEQILICGSAIDEEMAARVLERATADPAARSARRSPRHLGSSATGSAPRTTFEWVEPRAGVVGMPRFRDPESRSTSTASTATCSPSTAPTSGRATGSIRTAARFRLGFAWPPTDELRRGLDALLAAAAGARR